LTDPMAIWAELEEEEQAMYAAGLDYPQVDPLHPTPRLNHYEPPSAPRGGPLARLRRLFHRRAKGGG
jgi:hypothetical protein